MIKNLFNLTLLLLTVLHLDAQSFWRKSDESRFQLRSAESRNIIPDKYQTFTLDFQGLKTYLANAPMEISNEKNSNELLLEIPMPDGKTEMFRVYESPVMESEISARYPNIKSYKAYALLDRSKNMRFALSINGFHGSIKSLSGENYIDPYSSENIEDYIVYDVKDHNPDAYKGIQLCGVEDEARPAINHFNPTLRNAEEVELRTYRLALACTGEWGRVARRGTKEKCLADMNTMINRLNVIYEREMAIRYIIINDNDKLIFLDPATDPYENSSEGKKLVGINTSKLNALIPSSSYDIGHLLSICFDIGGVVSGRLCNASNKGNGVTCNNDSDLSRIVTRVLAHEIGHQLTAGHVWNNCDFDGENDQFHQGSAVEPGSGSTIMGYAGTCGVDNVVSAEDDYFNVRSLEQMYEATTNNAQAYFCAIKVLSGNHFPVITMPSKSYVIPISTPFELSAKATDEDGDNMTYCWEQSDTGASVPLGSQSAAAPLFRSFKPSATGDIRFFPRSANILSGSLNDKTEVLPNNSRDLNFRFTVRDNNSVAGGVIWGDYKISSTTQAGPFKITYPEIDVKFKVGDQVNVTWDVANTDKAPVNCKLVNIYGSFSAAIRNDDPNLVPLALNVPNDGNQVVYIPNRTSNFFRIIIKAVDHIFLTSSKIPSKIESPTTPGIFFETQQNFVKICQPIDGKIDFTTSGLAGFSDDIIFELASDLPSGTTATFSSTTVKAGQPVSLIINTVNVKGSQTGQILIRAFAPGLDTMERLVNIEIVGGNLSSLQTLLPENGSSGVVALPKFNWNRKVDAEAYEIQLAKNPDFAGNNLTASKETVDSTFTTPVILDKSTIYYWRVRAKNNCGAGDWSRINAFVTEALACNVYSSGDQSINISASGSPSVELPLQVFSDGTASDVNIKLIKAEHARLVDLVAYLVAPSGKEALLWSRKCGTQQNLNLGLDDQSPDFFQCPINTGKIYRPESLLSAFNGESIKGNWKLRIEDKQSGSGGRLQEFNLEICSNVVLDQPYMVKNDTLKIYPGNKRTITNELLLAADNNNSASELIYTLVYAPSSGILTFNGNQITAGARFTQEELNSAKISFEDTSEAEGSDYFSFTVADGQGGWIGITSFNILRDADFVNAAVDYHISQDIYVNPNPTSGDIQVILTGKAITLTNYAIADIAGRRLLSGMLNSGKTDISLSDLSNGIYLLRMFDGKTVISKKIVKI